MPKTTKKPAKASKVSAVKVSKFSKLNPFKSKRFALFGVAGVLLVSSLGFFGYQYYQNKNASAYSTTTYSRTPAGLNGPIYVSMCRRTGFGAYGRINYVDFSVGKGVRSVSPGFNVSFYIKRPGPHGYGTITSRSGYAAAGTSTVNFRNVPASGNYNDLAVAYIKVGSRAAVQVASIGTNFLNYCAGGAH